MNHFYSSLSYQVNESTLKLVIVDAALLPFIKPAFVQLAGFLCLLLLTKTTCPSDWDRGGSLLGPAGRGGVIKGAGSVLVLRRFSQVLMRYIVDAGSLHVWGVNRRLEEVKVQGGAYQWVNEESVRRSNCCETLRTSDCLFYQLLTNHYWLP